MAWIKVPKENHPLFLAALPKDPRLSTLQMFGGIAGLVNGNMMGGLFGRSVVLRLDPTSRAEAMALDGSELFDPMGNGRVMKDMVLFPEAVLDEPAELRSWLRRSLEHTATLPKKPKKKRPAPKATKPARKTTKPRR